MKIRECFERLFCVTGCVRTLLIAGIALLASHDVMAFSSYPGSRSVRCRHSDCRVRVAHETCDVGGGNWYWVRSPEQEARVVASLYNNYCIRCHGVDGRGVWDIPDVPDFTSARWQASRTDAQLARLILEGRGAVMPAFRGTLALEEAWAMGRY